MDHKINSILEDLFQIDPNFKKHEKQIRTLIIDLLKSKPNTQFDEKFAMRLREDLMRANAKAVVSPYTTHFSFLNLRYSLIGSLATLLLVIPLAYYGTQSKTSTISTGFSLEQQINNKGLNAFGSLGTVNTDSSSGIGGAPTTFENVTLKTPDESISGAMGGGVNSMSATSKMIYPAQVTTYSYVGEPIVAPSAQGIVYKRIKNADSSSQLASILSKANFGLVNLDSFTGLKTRNIEIVEDKDTGYAININFDEGMIAINPNWQKWDMGATEPLPLSKRPTDEALIATANNFLAERNINRSLYAAPIVQDMQNVMYAQGAPEATLYAPDVITIVYPLLIDGVEVYEDGGMPYGLNVNVNVRENKVSGVYNISSQVYESASYDLETDTQKILDQATYSFVPEFSRDMPKPEMKTVSLQTPKSVLMRHWSYASNGESSELYVPALLFPTTATSTPYAPRAVVVPLVKSILEERKAQTPVMPLDTPSSEPLTL